MQVIPVHIEREIGPSDDLPAMILGACGQLQDGDVVVVTQKAVSKQEGRVVALSGVRATRLAEGIASQYGRDPRVVELILSETRRIVRMRDGIIISQTRSGLVCANAGVDESNVRDGYAVLLPEDPDASARRIRGGIMRAAGSNVGVIVSDTFGRPFRMGQTDCAIGVSGLDPVRDYSGTTDSFGRRLRVTAIAVADELAAAAELVMGKALMRPAAVIRGHGVAVAARGAEGAGGRRGLGGVAGLVRPEGEDLFR